MVRVCCACGAQEKALNLVAEAQAGPISRILLRDPIVFCWFQGRRGFPRFTTWLQGEGRQATTSDALRCSSAGAFPDLAHLGSAQNRLNHRLEPMGPIGSPCQASEAGDRSTCESLWARLPSLGLEPQDSELLGGLWQVFVKFWLRRLVTGSMHQALTSCDFEVCDYAANLPWRTTSLHSQYPPPHTRIPFSLSKCALCTALRSV